MYKISKELFEAVMGIEIDSIESVASNNILAKKDGVLKTAVVDSFFFKCKEWAFEQGYVIFSSNFNTSIYQNTNGYCGWVINNLDADSEQQAVFNACQWILEKYKK